MSNVPNHPPPTYEESQLIGTNDPYYPNIPSEFAEGGKVGESSLEIRMANRYLLGLFTFMTSLTIGIVSVQYELDVVLQALILAIALFVSLTLFTFQSKYDFSKLGPILFFALLGVIFVGLINIFIPFGSTFRLVIAVVSVIIFCGFILFDTYMIINHLYPDQYIDACISLYLDFINLFLNLLRILGNSDN
ncbi:hypothetical protein H4219_000182 [Mycoemilia scoparia]|uniref:Uncharacterized protein n=1 Tax=Mycoemilia scoparia TaxID=417184 RepID=A0A9W8A3Z4_9FUNG|nr:hypothetical protein H4219_000182 [Mycoemilia scoparia]